MRSTRNFFQKWKFISLSVVVLVGASCASQVESRDEKDFEAIDIIGVPVLNYEEAREIAISAVISNFQPENKVIFVSFGHLIFGKLAMQRTSLPAYFMCGSLDYTGLDGTVVKNAGFFVKYPDSREEEIIAVSDNSKINPATVLCVSIIEENP